MYDLIGETVLKFYLRVMPERIPPTTVLYMRRTGAYGVENRKLMDRFQAWMKEHHLFDGDTVIYAVPMDDPGRTAPAQCRYDVCMERPRDRQPAGGAVKCRELECGKYLTFLLPHTAEAVQTAWERCFSELGELGCSLDESRPVVERYKKRLVDQHRCELCVPVLSLPRPAEGKRCRSKQTNVIWKSGAEG